MDDPAGVMVIVLVVMLALKLLSPLYAALTESVPPGSCTICCLRNIRNCSECRCQHRE